MKTNFLALAFLATVLTPISADAALRFSNLTDRVDVSPNSNINSLEGWTVLMWVKPSAITAGRAFFSKSNGLSTGIHAIIAGSDGSIEVLCGQQFSNAASLVTNPTSLSVGRWSFVAMSCNSNPGFLEVPKINVYFGSTTALAGSVKIDDELVDPATGADDDSPYNFQWGSQAGSNGFQGDIGWGMYFNRVLSRSEIRSLQFNPRFITGCVLYMQLGFNRTGTQRNMCGRGSGNGTVTGATLASGHPPMRSLFGF